MQCREREFVGGIAGMQADDETGPSEGCTIVRTTVFWIIARLAILVNGYRRLRRVARGFCRFWAPRLRSRCTACP